MKLPVIYKSGLLAVLLIGTTQCGEKGSLKPGSVVAPAPKDALFEREKSTGIDFENNIDETHQNTILTNSYLYNGGGVGVIDFNNDGLQDLYFVSTQGKCKLYQNLGNFSFKDVSEAAGVEAPEGDKTGVTIADVNADGWQDIYVCRTGLVNNDARRNLLFINNQNGTFTEKAKAFGLADGAASNHANFFDADNDGDLDCYVLNYPVDFKSVNSTRLVDQGGGVLVRTTAPNDPTESDHLYRNNGDNTFTDISKQAGIQNRAFGLSVTTTDINNDGFTDIVIGNDYIEPDIVYLNNPAQPGNFTDHYGDYFRHSSNHTMGVDIADINNDGLQDIVALDMLAEDYGRQKELMTTMLLDRYTTLAKYGYGKQQMRNVLQINNGRGSFSEIGCLAGVFQTDWSWGPLLEDFDNDGYRDLFIANGYRRDVSNLDYLTFTADSIEKTGGLTQKRFPKIQDYLNLVPSTPIQNYCFRNRGDLTFENVSTAWGFVERTYSNGTAYADLDNDGDMDLIINNIDMPAYVYKNKAVESGKGQSWLQIKVVGSPQNPFATGARARIVQGNQVFYEEINPTRGFLSTVEPLIHFGLGNITNVQRVEIEFPGGKLAVLDNVATNKRYTVKYSDAQPGKLSPLATQTPKMQEITAPVFVHKEDDIQDFNRERLLPWKLSNPGPALASGDVNGDGLDDFFVGNAAGSPGALFIQKAGGTFQESSTAVWAADQAYEDAGAVFFDADHDGDLDLCVTSGGNSFNANDPKYQPRLYRNDGHGNFSNATLNSFPSITGSTAAVSTHDIDGDGDDDLILGGWCTPLAYPTAPNSYVLRNNNGVFEDVTDLIANPLRKIGMVRAMTWADLNGDGKAELIVSGEWMPIEVFSLQKGKLERTTEQFGLNNTEGFWHSLAAVDVDQDGDMDIVAGNLGYNSRYTASPEAPLKLYAKDFDNNGSIDPIMTQTQGGKNVPVPMRDILLKQLPILKKKFVRYGPYAHATIEDLFEASDLSSALQFHVNYLGSAIFINNGGKFTIKILPNQAQEAPVWGIETFSRASGQAPDLVFVGNDYGQQVETGPIDAGNGLWLQNDSKGNFNALTAMQSGLWAVKEARGIKILRSTGGKKLVVVANNNDRLQLFEMNAPEAQ
ncbi:MAG: VCBS repeat-containing protein [Bacteroidota bacterium]